jgi:hypothetical protein
MEMKFVLTQEARLLPTQFHFVALIRTITMPQERFHYELFISSLEGENFTRIHKQQQLSTGDSLLCVSR